MLQNQPIEHQNRSRASTVSCPASISTIENLDYRSQLNKTKLPGFYTFSRHSIIPKSNVRNPLNEIYYSRHITNANICVHKITKQSLKKNEKLEHPKSEIETRKSTEFIETKFPCQQTQDEMRRNSTITITTISDIKLTRKYSSNHNEIQQNIGNQHRISPDFDTISCGSRVKILSSLSNSPSLTSVINTDNKKNICSKQIKSTSSHQSKIKDEKRKSKKKLRRYNYWRCTCCSCSPFCCILLFFGILLILAALTPLCISLPGTNKNTIMTTLTTIANTTATMEVTDTTTVATNITTSSTLVTSTTTLCKIDEKTTTITTTQTTSTTTSTTSSTITSSTTTKTTSTTTTPIYCGQSCLNQSWINSSGNLALWPFDGSYVDIINGYNGISSPNLPTFVTGYVNQAASFNVSARQAMYTSFIPLNNISFTVQAWIKPTGYPNPTDFSIVGLCSSSTLNNCLHINIRTTKLYFGFYSDDCKGNTVILLDQWIHTAFVFDAIKRTQTIFLNGFQDAQANTSGVLKAMATNFTVGFNEYAVSTPNYFQGYIDQLSISQRPKSSCEILEIATLAAYFKFDTPSPYTDSGPNSVSTTSSNTSIITGYNNQAISFFGSSNSYFQTWGFTSLGVTNQSFSITFWIRPQRVSGTILHLSTSSLGRGSTCFPLLGFTSNESIVAQVLISSTTVVTAVGPVLPISSSWSLIVQTWSSTNGLNLYMNSSLVNSVTASTFLGSGATSNYLTLGSCLSGCSRCVSGSIGTPGAFTGAIDDFRIYSRELTSDDVCTLFFGT